MRQPTFFLPHGGGPCFFMDWDPPETWVGLQHFLAGLLATLPERPKAILLVTAHWMRPDFALASAATPGLIYDYRGFPEHTYRLRYDAPGAPALAAQAEALLQGAGLAAAQDPGHGWDHGVWVPLKVMAPDADIPVLAMALRRDLDPAAHLAAGHALAALRDEGVLLVGSGMSYHDLRGLFDPRLAGAAEPFDAWLTEVLTARGGAARDAALTDWQAAPGAAAAHPHPDHLLPLMVAAGAAGEDAGVRVYSQIVLGQRISAFRFG